MDQPPAPSDDLLLALDQAVGAHGYSTDPERLAGHLKEPWGSGAGRSGLLLRPADTDEVAALLKLCSEHGVAVVPQGGITGLAGGGVPDASGRMAVLSLARLNRIRAVDPLGDTITVEAGCVLADVQAAADEAGRLLPLALGAQGSCTIGGNLATNAGGVNVLRYGMARALVLGLEVVLADGRVLRGLKALRKDNTGYDLKQLFIGSEGTLGVITAATLTLSPKPRERQTAWLAVPSVQAAVELLALTRETLGETISSFEFIHGDGARIAAASIDGAASLVAGDHPWYVLAELAWSLDGGLAERVEAVLERAFERALVLDGSLAASEAQRATMWAVRERQPEAMHSCGVYLRHDVAVAVSKVPAFIEAASAAVLELVPGARIMPFGHLGDGNVHFDPAQPDGVDGAAFYARKDEIQSVLFDVVEAFSGSISAEHGIGRLKRAELARRKSAEELALMRDLKRLLDPAGILNPGAVLAVE